MAPSAHAAHAPRVGRTTHAVRPTRNGSRHWLSGRDCWSHAAIEPYGSLAIRRTTPATGAFPMQDALRPSVMPVPAQPPGKACGRSSSSGTSLRHRPPSHLTMRLKRDAPVRSGRAGGSSLARVPTRALPRAWGVATTSKADPCEIAGSDLRRPRSQGRGPPARADTPSAASRGASPCRRSRRCGWASP